MLKYVETVYFSLLDDVATLKYFILRNQKFFLLHYFLPSLSFCNFRVMVMENVNKPQLWNIFNQVTMHSQEVRHHRFCLRLMLKNPDNHALCVLNGHNAFVSGSFKHALGKCPVRDFVKCGWCGG